MYISRIRLGTTVLARLSAAIALWWLVSGAAVAATNPWTLISTSASNPVPPAPNWSPPNQGSNAYQMPALADIDGDGKLDLMFGLSGGTLSAYRNSGTPSVPAWAVAPASWITLSSDCADSTFKAPSLRDLNGDGLLDLVIGTRGGVCTYQNTGTTAAPTWTRNTGWESGLASLATNRFYSTGLADLNGDGKVDMMVFSTFGAAGYQNIGTSAVPAWAPNTAWDAIVQDSRQSGRLADLDGDGKADLVLANELGTVQVFKNTGTVFAPTWRSAGNWYPAIIAATSNLTNIGIALGDLNGDGKHDLIVSPTTSSNLGPTAVYRQDPAGLPPPDFASGPPSSGGTTVLETFDAFTCTGAWTPAVGGPFNSYSRDCGNGWIAYAEDVVDANATPYPLLAGPVGDQNIVTKNPVNGPSAAPSTPLGAAEIGGNPDTARGQLWLLKNFPVAPASLVSVNADFRVGANSSNVTYAGVVVFDGQVTNPSGQTDSSRIPLRSDLLAAKIVLDGPSSCGVPTWCPWQTASFPALAHQTAYITVAFRLRNYLTTNSFSLDVDNLRVSGVQNLVANALPADGIAQLWSANYQAGGTNSGGQSSRSASPKVVKTDPAGNVYVVADSYNGLNNDIVTIKYSPTGSQLWKSTYDGGDSDQAAALSVDSAGNVYVTGRSYNTGNGSDDYVIVKYSSGGAQQWATRYDYLSRNDNPTGLAVGTGGGLYVTGSTCSADCKYATVKFDDAGVFQWQAIYDNSGASPNSAAVGIGADGAGNIYVVGTSGASSDDIVTIKYDGAGTQLRLNRYDTGNEDRAVAMAVDAAGNVYVTGVTFKFGYPSILTLKVASTALSGDAPQWTKVYSANALAQPTALALDGSGNVYVAGFTGVPGSFDWITVKYLSNGDTAWEQTFGNADLNDRATGIAVDGGGNVYVVGSLSPSAGQTVYALVKYDSSGVARSEITYQGASSNNTPITTNSPVGLVLGVDAQGDTVPTVIGVSRHASGLDSINTVRYQKSQPDLTITSVSGPSSATVGTAISVANTVLNISDLANKIYQDSGPFTVGLYLAPNQSGLADLNNLTPLGTRTVSNLTPGQSSASSTVVTIPSSVGEGSYFLVAKADSGGVVAEASETNNSGTAAAAIAIQGVLPDLTVSGVTGPASAVHGVAFNVTTTISNVVSTAVSGPFRVGIYASTSPAITPSDTLIGSYTVTSLAGNTSTTATTSVTIATAGTYYVGAIADDQNVITEVNEGNNLRLIAPSAGPSMLLVTRADFLAGLPGTNVAVATTGGAAQVRLAQSPQWTAVPAWDLPNVVNYAKPALGDLDGDGLLDAVAGNAAGALFAYRNTGTPLAPVWTAAPASWSSLSAVCNAGGFTTFAEPAVVDLNGDGLLDLVIGTRGGVCMYQNTGTAASPTWTRNTAWDTGLTTLTGNRFYAPALSDLDADGKVDLILGQALTSMLAYRNTGTASAPAWTLAPSSWQISGLGGTRNSPTLADLDGDGRIDMMIGEFAGGVLAYRNTGTSGAPLWTLNSAWNVADPNLSANNAAGPVLGDLDGDGKIDLLYGDVSGNSFAYRNTGPFTTPGTYISKVVDGGTHGVFTTLSYSAAIPSGTTLTVDIRAGGTATPDGTWTAWLTGIANGGDISALGTHRYVQYRFNLATADTAVSPAVFSIQANVQPPAPTLIPVSIEVGGGSGGGELSAVEVLMLGLFVLYGRRKGQRHAGAVTS